MKPLWFALALAVSIPLAAPVPADAQSAAKVAGAAKVADDQEETAMWVKRLDDAKDQLDAARKDIAKYQRAKGQGASRNYPVGPAKAVYLKGLKDSEVAYESARRALPQLVEEARRAGIVPGVLDPYEAAAAAAPPIGDLVDDAAAQANPGDDDVTQEQQGESGVDDDVDAAVDTDTKEAPAKNTDTEEDDPGPQTVHDDSE
jgi:hypothetical protein